MKSHVSLEQKLCPICGKTFDTKVLLLDRSLKASMEMHTTTGYGHCPTCKEKLDDNYIAIVEVSNAKNDETVLKIENAYRTGVIVWIRKLVAEEMFNLKITTPMLFGTPDLTEALSKIPTE